MKKMFLMASVALMVASAGFARYPLLSKSFNDPVFTAPGRSNFPQSTKIVIA